MVDHQERLDSFLDILARYHKTTYFSFQCHYSPETIFGDYTLHQGATLLKHHKHRFPYQLEEELLPHLSEVLTTIVDTRRREMDWISAQGKGFVQIRQIGNQVLGGYDFLVEYSLESLD